MINRKLKYIYHKIDQCRFCKRDRNKLQHVHGYGSINAKLMLVLVNPTHKNLSSNPKYSGSRFPFIGVRQFWKVLASGGLISKKIAYDLPLRSSWKKKNTIQIQRELIKNKLFLTNIVKCCYDHSDYPQNTVIKEQLKFLMQEIKIIKPKTIVAFGGLVYKTLTGKPINLSKYWNEKHAVREIEKISSLNTTVIPCYFPIGRGNPQKATKILRKLSQHDKK